MSIMKITEIQNQEMVSTIRKKGCLNQEYVEQAIRKTPRHFFVPEMYLEEAYKDEPIPTKNYQTISQPSVVAKMTEWLDVKEEDNILEIGCGSGWQSAILSKLATKGKIYTVERFPELINFSLENLKRAGIEEVKVIEGDGTFGIPEKAPFDKIIITAACSKVPSPLIEQLKIGGLVIAPIGADIQTLTLFKKTIEGLKEIKKEYGYVFVPFIGKFGFDEKIMN